MIAKEELKRGDLEMMRNKISGRYELMDGECCNGKVCEREVIYLSN